MANFKARARALDMLGRQQIAGIPTAISELFKNAHDAYADRAEIDYYKSDNLFILRDDGVGMTKEDFLQRWLTLGTESKVGSRHVNLPAIDMQKSSRPLLGEKGIGRLAIALLGKQLLILSRAKREDGLHDLVAAFIHWELFECPGLDLDQIEIPVRTFPAGDLPTANDLASMVEDYRQNVLRLKEIIPISSRKQILADLALFQFDPFEVNNYVQDLSLEGKGHGTHFIIKPASSLVSDSIEINDTDKASDLVRMLAGFSNTMTPNHPKPVLDTRFRYHKTEDYSEDLIEPQAFFTPKEFEKADHQISGTFDEYGQFKGSICVYGNVTENHQIVWKESRGNKTKCGAFSVNFASVQGEAYASLIEQEEWFRLIQKMNLFGGLYVYRNNIRILPYGNNDYDWLDIERNRTKRASDYFFSFRRMFGVVNLMQGENDNLYEKAGREGFRENEAYRQFKGILKNFFVQLAKDFFQVQSPNNYFDTKKNEFKRLDELRKKREQQISGKKKRFEKDLDIFFNNIENAAHQKTLEIIKQNIENELNKISFNVDFEGASEKIINFEQEALRKVSNFESTYLIAKPRGIAFSKKTLKDWNDYLTSYEKLSTSIFTPLRQEIKEKIDKYAHEFSIQLDKYYRIETAINVLTKETKDLTSKEKKNTESQVNDLQKKVIEIARESSKKITTVITEVQSDLAKLDVNSLSDEKIVEKQISLESLLIKTKEDECERLRSIQAQIEAIDISGKEGNFLDQMEALEQKAINLEEQADADLQLTQLGMAIEIINHEFNSTILAIRKNLKRLKTWADVNPALNELYQKTRNSFDHLDGYLTLFTPLHRRLQRKAVKITGKEVAEFIQNLFKERFVRHEVSLVSTTAFNKAEIHGYPSSFYPVFVNLIDNATYWCKDKANATITLDFINESTFVIKDNGAGIPMRDFEEIFEAGFSRKPGGRGLGLFISKSVLNQADYNLCTVESSEGAEFHISPVESEE